MRDEGGESRDEVMVIGEEGMAESGQRNADRALRSFWRFAGLAMVLSWVWWVPIAFTRQNAVNTEFIFLLILGGCGPSFAALYLTRREGGPGALKAFARRVFALRFGLVPWLAIVLVWPLLFGLAALLASRFGGYPYPYSPLWTVFDASPVMIVPQLLVFLLWGPLSEEYGWRGYALEQLLSEADSMPALGKLKSALLVGGVWALWQLPLFFIVGTAESNLRPALFLLNILGLSVIYTALYTASGRKLGAAVALHFFYNLTLGFVPLLDKVTFAWLVGLVYLVALGIVVGWVVKDRRRG